jgi:hypothetical protein
MTMTQEEISEKNRAKKTEIALTIANQMRLQKMPNIIVLKAISNNERPTSSAVLEGIINGGSYRIDTLLSALAVLGIDLKLVPTYGKKDE